MRGEHRYLALDGLRGIAAVAVMLFHRRWEFHSWLNFGHGYLAVDFFFALSGFILFYSYGDKLKTGALSLGGFLRKRAIRLWPMLALGAVLGGSYWVIHRNNAVEVWIAAVLALFGMPSPAPLAYTPSTLLELFPINGPSWSLFFEMTVSIIFAVTARLAGIWLAAICGAAFAVLLFGMWQYGGISVLGPLRYGAESGLARATFSFFVGVGVYKIQSGKQSWLISVPFPLLCVALLAILATPAGSVFYDLVCITLIFPLLILLGAKSRCTGPIATFATVSGEVSYPVYLLHYPLFGWWEIAGWSQQSLVWYGMPSIVVVSFVVLKLYDEPVRKLLSKTSSRTT